MLRRMLLVAWIGSHAETDLARTMGVDYTAGTVGLCEDYLAGQADGCAVSPWAGHVTSRRRGGS